MSALMSCDHHAKPEPDTCYYGRRAFFELDTEHRYDP